MENWQNLPAMVDVCAANALFNWVLATLNDFGTASSDAALTGGVILTLFATTGVVARKYGAKLPDFVITFMFI